MLAPAPDRGNGVGGASVTCVCLGWVLHSMLPDNGLQRQVTERCRRAPDQTGALRQFRNQALRFLELRGESG